ncbi:leucine-rich repeat-containing protein 70-like [Chironomus tepperi]|uniref:leucine-rich repeat-containing protein 70-like n=1 Tax=Chironomus tepperi TaxID=113505 RepID=UPI00391EEFC8
MWRKLLLLITTTWMISSTNSAIMQCQWSGDVCQNVLAFTPVTQVNEMITVYGQPVGYVNTLTNNMALTNFFLKYVPTNIFSTFTGIKWFSMTNCSTTALMTDSFKNCASMESFSISGGNIPYVSEGIAQTCINIKSVWLRSNNIEAIDKNAFKGLVNLNMIELTYNKLTCLQPDVFQTSPLLQNIFLEYNAIAGIDRNLFRGLKYLLNVYLSYNMIRYLPTLNLTQDNANAMGISLYRNPIIAIKPDFCSSFATRSASYNDLINLKNYNDPVNIPCLPAGSTFNQITKWNCASSVSILQSCYNNYTAAMPDLVSCELNPVCVPGSVWYKLIDFLRTLSF